MTPFPDDRNGQVHMFYYQRYNKKATQEISVNN